MIPLDSCGTHMTSLRFLSLRSFWSPIVSTDVDDDDDDDDGGDGNGDDDGDDDDGGGGAGDDDVRLAFARRTCYGVEGIDEDVLTRSRLVRHLHPYR